MRAFLIAVGSELLGCHRLDTNSLFLTSLLEDWGVEVVGKSVIGDELDALRDEVAARLGRVDLLILGGGLGPTTDDLTREAVAGACGRGLEEDPAIVEHIRSLFARWNREMPDVNRRQARVIEGAELLQNRRGTAPGQRLEVEGTTVFLFPGVPREMKGMVKADLEPWLEGRSAEHPERVRWTRRTMKVACLPESTVEERIAPAYDRWGREAITVLGSPGEIRIELRRRGTGKETERWLDEAGAHLRSLIGDAVFVEAGEGKDRSLEEVVVELLLEAGETVATAESCTGGLMAERLTRVPGASGCFEGSVVAYSDRIKSRLLGVKQEAFEEHGAVSGPVARLLAEGAVAVVGSDWGVGITGIAGPAGGTEDKPVGTVHLAWCRRGGDTEHRQVLFPGSRERVRFQTSQLALEILRRRLLAERSARGPVVGSTG